MTLWAFWSLVSTGSLGYLLHAGWVPTGSGIAEIAWLALALAATATVGLLEPSG